MPAFLLGNVGSAFPKRGGICVGFLDLDGMITLRGKDQNIVTYYACKSLGLRSARRESKKKKKKFQFYFVAEKWKETSHLPPVHSSVNYEKE